MEGRRCIEACTRCLFGLFVDVWLHDGCVSWNIEKEPHFDQCRPRLTVVQGIKRAKGLHVFYVALVAFLGRLLFFGIIVCIFLGISRKNRISVDMLLTRV